jgi:TPP-dependent pyruvate/acetoin dehydrogenase alpha subunit
MPADLKLLYPMMLRARVFEQHVQRLWEKGAISGEMHMSLGEEGIVAGIIAHMREPDAMALDHRGTAPLIMRGEDPVLLLKEFLGRPDGLCRGRGGHMHLFSQKSLSASSGIVGASGPAAVGFALARRNQNQEAVAVAFFGEGAMNQGMLLESMNLASAWHLPVVFVCKDNRLSISTASSDMTGGNLRLRAQGLGLVPYETDGSRVDQVWETASQVFHEVRQGGPPAFLLAHCCHYEGHFLGDGYLRLLRQPLRQAFERTGETLRSLASSKGMRRGQRLQHLRDVLSPLQLARAEQKGRAQDPLKQARNQLEQDSAWLKETEQAVSAEMEAALRALAFPSEGGEGGE